MKVKVEKGGKNNDWTNWYKWERIILIWRALSEYATLWSAFEILPSRWPSVVMNTDKYNCLMFKTTNWHILKMMMGERKDRLVVVLEQRKIDKWYFMWFTFCFFHSFNKRMTRFLSRALSLHVCLLGTHTHTYTRTNTLTQIYAYIYTYRDIDKGRRRLEATLCRGSVLNKFRQPAWSLATSPRWFLVRISHNLYSLCVYHIRR